MHKKIAGLLLVALMTLSMSSIVFARAEVDVQDFSATIFDIECHIAQYV